MKKWNTPLIATTAGLIALTSTFVFDRLNERNQASNIIRLEKIRTELQLVASKGEATNTTTLEQSEARPKQELEIGKNRSLAEIEAEAKEREFQCEIVRAKLLNTEKSDAKRAAALLFTDRTGVLGSLNTNGIISMIHEQKASPGNIIIPTLSGSIEKRVEQAMEEIDQIEKEPLAIPEDTVEKFGFS